MRNFLFGQDCHHNDTKLEFVQNPRNERHISSQRGKMGDKSRERRLVASNHLRGHVYPQCKFTDWYALAFEATFVVLALCCGRWKVGYWRLGDTEVFPDDISTNVQNKSLTARLYLHCKCIPTHSQPSPHPHTYQRLILCMKQQHLLFKIFLKIPSSLSINS